MKDSRELFLAKLFKYLSSIMSLIRGVIYWRVTIFRFDHTTGENQQLHLKKFREIKHMTKMWIYNVGHMILVCFSYAVFFNTIPQKRSRYQVDRHCNASSEQSLKPTKQRNERNLCLNGWWGAHESIYLFYCDGWCLCYNYPLHYPEGLWQKVKLT